MDYIFRWLHLRFLSGEQLTLFAGLGLKAPQLPASPSLAPETDAEEVAAEATQQHIARLAEEVAKRLSQVQAATPGAPRAAAAGGYAGGAGYGAGAPAGGGIAPEVQPRQAPQAAPSRAPMQPPSMQDRGVYHAADAMRGMYDMGDAPSCNVCGAIMVRNGSCYRCMSCGSTSGCS